MVRTAQATPTSYELLTRRIHRQVMSPNAQSKRQTVIVREPREREDDWDLLLERLGEEESVRMIWMGKGVVQLTWTNQHPD